MEAGLKKIILLKRKRNLLKLLPKWKLIDETSTADILLKYRPDSRKILVNESGIFYKINIIFCAELSATNCCAELSNAELSAPNCPAPNCPDTVIAPRQVYVENREHKTAKHKTANTKLRNIKPRRSQNSETQNREQKTAKHKTAKHT